MNLATVISPEFDFCIFCGKMVDQNLATVLHTASAEISYSRRNHRLQTGRRSFRKGSKGRKYCDHLMALIRMLMNGRMPENPDAEFMSAVSPLMRRFLMKWQVGELDIKLFKEHA